uniref:YqaJ viral recombinase domain-containing protein n=1 Tax=viral metagenome TaxID=1070528 RepID=A0A6C0KIE6_9ZZZZ
MSSTSSFSDLDTTSSTDTPGYSRLFTDKTWTDAMVDDDWYNIEEQVAETIHEYIETNLLHYSSPNFAQTLITSVSETLFADWVTFDLCANTDADYDELEQFVKTAYELYMTTEILPPRQQPFCENVPGDKSAIAAQIRRLRDIPQPTQRTKEWHESRYHMITASNISKALGSEAQRNSLIYEKCKPLVIYEGGGGSGSVNTETSMHWGVKYEPVTKMIYEQMYCTQVTEFGCIPHPQYPFIGASPDGIVTDPDHERYGHMVEIKNIFNREITGIPKEEYWIQMQIQMETCDLDYCDFVETRIKEYETVELALADQTREYKGILLHFVRKMLVAKADEVYDGSPHYVYMPLDTPFTQESITQWILSQRAEFAEDYVLFDTKYWYCDEISCVLVPRNRAWFAEAVPVFVETWDTIVRERVEGYEHRMAKKKTMIATDACGNHIIHNMPASGGICLIKLDENGLLR